MNEDYSTHSQKYDLTGFCFLGGFLLYVIFFYPGFMSYDSVLQIVEARHGTYSDWHPPAMAHLWGVVENLLVPGPVGMLVLQSALLWSGAYLTYRAYFRRHGGIVAALALCLILFFPPIFGIAGVIWKDILMWGLLFLAFGIAGHIKPKGDDKPMKSVVLVSIVLMLLMAAILTRHNAVFATIPLSALAFARWFDYKTLPQLIISLVAGIVFAASSLVGASYINGQLTDQKTHAWVSLSVFDTAGVVVRLSDREEQQALYDQIPEIMRQARTVDAMLQHYSPRYWRTLLNDEPIALREPPVPSSESHAVWVKTGFSQLDPDELKQLQQLWLSLPRDYPMQWLSHRFAVFGHVIGLNTQRLQSPAMMQPNGFPKKMEAHYGRNPEQTTLQRIAEGRIASLDGIWLFRPWFYIIIAVIVVIVALLRFDPQYVDTTLLAISGLLHEAALLLLAPSVDFRYSHYLIFAAILSLLMLTRPALSRLEHRKN